MVKKVLIIILIIFLLVLDWAALHDILKGEPNPVEEWIILILSSVVYIGLVMIYFLQRIGKK